MEGQRASKHEQGFKRAKQGLEEGPLHPVAERKSGTPQLKTTTPPNNDGQHRQGGRTRRRCEGQAEIIIQGETGKGALRKEKEKSRKVAKEV